MIPKVVHEFTVVSRVVSAVLKQSAARSRSVLLGALALCAAILGFNDPVLAETLSISATGLVMRCPCDFGDNTDSAQESKGVFVAEKPNGRYFIPVVFPDTTGQNVCSFSMAYQDINQADTMTARLFRKSYTVGGNPFAAPAVIATVKSAAGVVNTVRVATTNVIKGPTITSLRSFYYIEVDIPTTNLNILGFQIVYQPTCP
jgi:hypothetical protein